MNKTTAKGYPLINMDDLEQSGNIDLLSTNVIFMDEFRGLDISRQREIYNYCISHANREICRENLKQIRYAVTELYFEEHKYD